MPPRVSPVAAERALCGAVALFAGALSVARIGDYDIWYHLRVGRLVLESGIPATDPFAYTAAGQPASVQSWLAGVLYHLAERVAGVPGVQLFNAAVVASAFALLFATARLASTRREDAYLSALLVLLAALASRFRLGPRPHVLELLFLSADLFVLQRLRIRGRAPLWVIPAVQVAWVNVHGSHVLGLALPLLFLAGEAVQRRLPARLSPSGGPAPPLRDLARAVARVVAASAVATLANPQGWRAFEFPFRVAGMRGYMERIGEWQPMTWDLLLGYGARYTWGFSALVVLAAVGLATARRIAVADALLLAVFGAMAARGVRLIPEFAVASVPGIFAALSSLASRLDRGRWRALAAASLAAAGTALPLAWLDRSYQPGFGKKEPIFPDGALAFAERAGIAGPVFNSFAFGDYMVYRSPAHEVYIHGRNEVFPEAFYQEYLEAHRDPSVFRRVVSRWGIEWILLEYTLTDYSRREAMPHLMDDPEWVPVYWDRVSALYVRRGGVNAPVAERLGFRLVGPMWFDFRRLDPVVRRGEAGRALAELDQVVDRAPGNEEAWLARAELSYGLDDLGAARSALARAAEINPDRAATQSALGVMELLAGDQAGARARFERALRLDGADPNALEGLRRLGVDVPRPGGAQVPAGHP